MTILAPYIYIWGYLNNAYKLNSLTDAANKLNAKTMTLAFVIGDGKGGISQDIYNMMPDIKQFQATGGQIIISFGGANGPYIEDNTTEDQEFTAIDKLLQDFNCKAIDFDIEGAYIANTTQNHQRSKVITRLQNKYPDMYVSFTLAVEMPHPEWSSNGGLSHDGLTMLTDAINCGVKISIVNLMCMDYYGKLPSGKSWGNIANDIADQVNTQLKMLYNSDKNMYKMIGQTPMIGQNDDSSIFTENDALTVSKYANDTQIGLIAYWAMNRDQTGTGSLAIYSNANSTRINSDSYYRKYIRMYNSNRSYKHISRDI